MTQISTGGGGLQIGAGADHVLALIKLIADPDLHAQRLNELVAAEKAAQAAQEAAAMTQTATAKIVEGAKAQMIELDVKRAGIDAAHAAFRQQMDSANASMVEREQALKESHDALDRATAAFAKRAESHGKAMTQREAEVAIRENNVDLIESSHALREKRLAIKEKKLKEFMSEQA